MQAWLSIILVLVLWLLNVLLQKRFADNHAALFTAIAAAVLAALFIWFALNDPDRVYPNLFFAILALVFLGKGFRDWKESKKTLG